MLKFHKLKKLISQKKIKYLLLSLMVLAVVLSSTAIAFGEDSVEGVQFPESILLEPYTGDALELDNNLRQISYDIALASGESGTRATDYAQSIYNLLIGLSSSSNGFMVYDSYSRARLQEISDYCSELTAVGGVSDRLYDIYVELVQMLEGVGGDSYLQSIYYALDLILNQQLIPIKNGVNSINSTLSTTNSWLSGISSVGSNIYSRQLDIKNSLDSFKSANHSDILSLKDTLNNIDWSDFPNTQFLGFKINRSDSNYITSNAGINSKKFYAVFNFGNNFTARNDIIAKFHIPVRSSNYQTDITYNTSVTLYPTATSSTPYNGDYILVQTANFLDIYFYNFSNYFYSSLQPIYLEIDSSIILNNYESISTATAQYISSAYSDYYTVYDWLNQRHIDNDLHNQNDILNRFKEIYASDDLVAAKQAQQQYEDQAISDFTGSGSAAAGGSDLNGAKQISGSLKNGLSTGVSVSDGLGFFNSGSFWSWFSQSNSDQINNLYVPSRGDSKSNLDYYDPDLYNDNLGEIFSHMQGDTK